MLMRLDCATKNNSLSHLKSKSQLTTWKEELSKDQVRIILDVLYKLEIDIYSDRAEPDYAKLYLKKVLT